MNYNQVSSTKFPPETTRSGRDEQRCCSSLRHEVDQPRYRARLPFIEMTPAEHELTGTAVDGAGKHFTGVSGDRCSVHSRNLFERDGFFDLKQGGEPGQPASGNDGEAHEVFRSLRRLTITMASSSLSR